MVGEGEGVAEVESRNVGVSLGNEGTLGGGRKERKRWCDVGEREGVFGSRQVTHHPPPPGTVTTQADEDSRVCFLMPQPALLPGSEREH